MAEAVAGLGGGGGALVPADVDAPGGAGAVLADFGSNGDDPGLPTDAVEKEAVPAPPNAIAVDAGALRKPHAALTSTTRFRHLLDAILIESR